MAAYLVMAPAHPCPCWPHYFHINYPPGRWFLAKGILLVQGGIWMQLSGSCTIRDIRKGRFPTPCGQITRDSNGEP